jgi:hypothetical protein
MTSCWTMPITSWIILHQLVKKSSPVTRHGGAWGKRRYSSYSFTTSALDGGEWSASHPGRALPLEKGPPVPIVQEAGWAPEPVWTQRLQKKILCPCRGSNPDRPVVQPVVRHYTAWATPAPFINWYEIYVGDTQRHIDVINILTAQCAVFLNLLLEVGSDVCRVL